ncbi:MAG: type II toxin-antitoxin system RelE/ParE family toxin [Chloroflexi bacterium]|nr:type II toxin-antitoxin system RelE/ParE family toxin [Chloroflexota bacterium]
MLPIKVTSSAVLQIEEAASWWSDNRPAAPLALRDDLQQAFTLISEQPNIGAAATNAALPGVRRIHLGRIRYFLYYRIRPDQVEILALWHASRGQEPSL